MLNLTDSGSSEHLKRGYSILKTRCDLAGISLPENKKSSKGSDVLLRDLDCAVIQQIHDYNNQKKLPKFDSVRGVFVEGEPPYPGAEFREKTHVQICVVNPNCIKAVFRPLVPNKDFPLP